MDDSIRYNSSGFDQRNDKTFVGRRTAAEFPSRCLYAMRKSGATFFDVDDLLRSFFIAIGLPKKSTGG
jgi:hypothetical protein